MHKNSCCTAPSGVIVALLALSLSLSSLPHLALVLLSRVAFLDFVSLLPLLHLVSFLCGGFIYTVVVFTALSGSGIIVVCGRCDTFGKW